MQFRKTLISCAMLVLCCFSFASCAAAHAEVASTTAEKETRDESGRALQFPMHFRVNGVSYCELDQETIHELNLSVESTDGLVQLGTIDGTERTFRRPIFKNKKDYDAETTIATVADTVYYHPNPQYPNLLVAIVDGKPAIFEWSGSQGKQKREIGSVMKENYGLTDAEKIRAIRIEYIQGVEIGILSTTVTDQAELKAFFDAVNEQSAFAEAPNPYDELEKMFPSYVCEVEMENGFSFGLSYNPQYKHLSFAGAIYEINDTLAAWLESHAKK